MDYLRGLFIAGCLALSGSGIAIVVLDLHRASPRLTGAGIAAAVIGFLAGGLVLGRALGVAGRD